MAEAVKKDDALALAVREAFQRHMENARLAALVNPAPESVARSIDVKPQPPERPAELPPPEPSKAKAGVRGKGGKTAEAKAVQPEPKPRETRLDVQIGRASCRERV